MPSTNRVTFDNSASAAAACAARDASSGAINRGRTNSSFKIGFVILVRSGPGLIPADAGSIPTHTELPSLTPVPATEATFVQIILLVYLQYDLAAGPPGLALLMGQGCFMQWKTVADDGLNHACFD